MKRSLGLLALAWVCASPVTAGGDLLYTYRPVEISPLKGYDNQPYWRVLAQCAGVHGALANQFRAAGRTADYERAKTRGVSFLRVATERIQADRGLAEEAAKALAAEEVRAGRDTGEALLAGRPGSGYSHAQLIDLLCTQVSDRHQAAARRR